MPCPSPSSGAALAPRPGEHRREEATGVAALARRDLLGRAGDDDLAAAVAALGAEVDDPVGGLDDVEVVLDDEHGVAGIDQALQHDQQLAHVVEVQAGGRLVEDVEGAPGAAPLQLARELDALRLAAGQRRRRLAEMHVAQPDVVERLELAPDRRDVLEEVQRLFDASCRGSRRRSCPCR